MADADSLAFWPAASGTAKPVVTVNFKTVPRRSSGDIKLRVKNQSRDYTAVGVVVSIEDITAGSGDQILLSADGLNFGPTLDLGDLTRTAISPQFWIRRTTASTAVTGAQQARLRVHATSWTASI